MRNKNVQDEDIRKQERREMKVGIWSAIVVGGIAGAVNAYLVRGYGEASWTFTIGTSLLAVVCMGFWGFVIGADWVSPGGDA